MTDDDLQPMTRAEAAAWCKMSLPTFDKKVRPFLKQRQIGTKKSQIYFLRRDLRRVYAQIFGESPD